MREKVGSAPLAESAPLSCETYSPVLLKPREINSEGSETRFSTQLALAPVAFAPFLTCTRVMPWGACKGTKFRRFAGPTGIAYRCEKCAGKADTAVCSCGNGYLAHGDHGCNGVNEEGTPCECQLRGGR